MNIKSIAMLAIVATLVSLDYQVHAQSSAPPNPTQPGYTLTGNSLEGIGNRSAQNDFKSFFNSNLSTNNRTANQTPSNWQLNQVISLPDTPILLQPAQQTVNGNDGLQVQLDLVNEPKRTRTP